MRRKLAALFAFLTLGAAAAPAPSALDRFARAASALDDYAVTIDAHEVAGTATQDYRFRYERAGRSATLHVVAGPGAGDTLRTGGDGRVSASRDGVPFVRERGDARDGDFTTLRGNGILEADVAQLARCLSKRANAVEERPGPPVDGEVTRALVLRGPDCGPATRMGSLVTTDVVDLSERTWLPVLRRRFVGREAVERWYLHDFRLGR